ncbi:MAG: TolC family protein [Elusimicrobia bacterium]|nr:TolC family protein [Elusimicrobiota bacterium]
MKRWAFLLLLGAAAAPAAAVDVSTFTAQGYVQSVLAAAPEVQQAAAQFAAARAAWKSQTASAWLPTVGFTGLAYPYGHDINESYRFQHWNLARADTSLATTVNLNLFNSFSDYFKVRQAALSRDSAEQGLALSQQARAFAAAQAFYDLGLKERLVAVSSENLKIQKDNYDLTRDHYQNGMRSLADLLKSETDWHSSELNITQAEANRKQSLLQFNLLVGRPADAPAALADELDAGTTSLPGLAADLDAALSRRPAMVSARLALEASEVAASQAVRDGAPQLSLDASYNRTDNGRNIGNVSPDPNYQLALSLSLPSGFNGASQWLSVSAARARAAASRQSLAVATRQVRSDVHSAYIALESALATYRIASITEDIARRSFELVNEQYKQNSADAIRLSQAQLDFLTARTSRAQALFGALLIRYQYRLAIGEPLWK